jgi:4-carboxymuconolactone decarboxylase
VCWGSIWTRPGLELKTRSFLNLAMMCALNRSPELAVHTRGALNNGATPEEIREVILQASCYCGMPAGMEAFKVTAQVIGEWRKEQEAKGHEVDVHTDVGVADRVADE